LHFGIKPVAEETLCADRAGRGRRQSVTLERWTSDNYHEAGQNHHEAGDHCMKKDEPVAQAAVTQDASALIDDRIKELGDWRGEMLGHIRTFISQADPEVVEEWKWRGVPVWSHAGILCTGETYKSVVKMTFAQGAALEDPAGLFNASLEGNTRRAIDVHEGEKLDEKALKALIKSAVALNLSRAAARRKPVK
jgi:hypothetical protein